MTTTMSHLWHSPLATSLPYMSSISSSTSSHRDIMLSMGRSPVSHEEEEEYMYRLEEEEEEEQTITSDTSSHPSNDGSDDEIDAIRRAIEMTLGSGEKEEEEEEVLPTRVNPRAKLLGKLGIGARPAPVAITRPVTRLSPTQAPRTPPTSPIDDPSDDSLDAMLALMGCHDDMMHIQRSAPIDIPVKRSTPINIPTTRVRHIRPSHTWMYVEPSIRTSVSTHGWDSDDDDDYFDGPQCEDLSASMLFDY